MSDQNVPLKELLKMGPGQFLGAKVGFTSKLWNKLHFSEWWTSQGFNYQYHSLSVFHFSSAFYGVTLVQLSSEYVTSFCFLCSEYPKTHFIITLTATGPKQISQKSWPRPWKSTLGCCPADSNGWTGSLAQEPRINHLRRPCWWISPIWLAFDRIWAVAKPFWKFIS